MYPPGGNICPCTSRIWLQAGFKGALSFRADHGVPGYTGYCPSSANMPLNLKGGTTRTGAWPVHTLCRWAPRARKHVWAVLCREAV